MGIAECILAIAIMMVICGFVILVRSWKFPDLEEIQRQVDKRTDQEVKRILKEEGWFKE